VLDASSQGSLASASSPAVIADAQPSASGRFLPWLLVAAAAAFLIWHSLRYNFVTDDAYISFVYARNLVEHGELTFNLGDYVEGYSNFSWTVILAGLLALGISPEWAARVLGTACAVAAMVVVARLTERALPHGSHQRSLWSALPAMFLASSSGFACWSSGGLETQLFTLLCVAAIERFAAATSPSTEAVAARRLWAQTGVLIAMAAMTRPEGLLLAAVLAAIALLRNGAAAVPIVDLAQRRQRSAFAALSRIIPAAQWRAVLGFALLWVPWTGWRLWYYGWPFPNTYYVKAHGPWQPPALAAQMWANGGYYVLSWLRQTGLLWASPLALLGLFGPLVSARSESWRVRVASLPITAVLIAFAAVYLLYAVSVGGDFMGLHRFIMPVFAIAAIAVTLGLRRVVAHRYWARWPRSIGIAIVVSVLVAFAAQQQELTAASVRWGNFDSDRGIDTPAFLIAYTNDRAAIGRALRDCLHPDDFSIVGGAGAQPYAARMRAIDVFGLVSDRVAHQEPRTRARAGHTKWASDALLLAYQPTLIFSCYAIGDTATAPLLDCAAPWLSRGFEQLTLHVPALRKEGTYYTFLARKDRAFQCPAVKPAKDPPPPAWITGDGGGS
jgi:arabinofuranosyltransferase